MEFSRIGCCARRALQFVALATALAAPVAGASSTADDLSDLWWNASENGWGVQMIHRGNTIFATTFIFDSAGRTTWAVASMAPGASWTGDLYVGTGPYFGGAWDPSKLVPRKAGTMTWTPNANGVTGTLAYTIDGVAVTEVLERQTIVDDNYAGRYYGALSYTNTCNGVHENRVAVTVTQTASNVSINWSNQDTSDSCSFAGRLATHGRTATVDGSFECGPIHDDGSFTFTDMVVTPYSLTARYTSLDDDTTCSSSGYMALARRR